MPWYGWYSTKEENMYGYAHYQNKKGDLVCITKISQDPNFNHCYKDSIYQGELTHFIQVQKWNCIKRNRKIAHENILSNIKYQYEEKLFGPKKIIN